MSNESTFETVKDYGLPLLYLLHSLSDGQCNAAEACRMFERRYGDQIPQAHRQERTSRGDAVWEYRVHVGRHYLWKRGFLHSPNRGVWRLTEEGRRWAKENPDARSLPPMESRRTAHTARRPTRASRRESQFGINLDMLEQTRKVMPAEEFRQVWGELYDQLLTEERAKAISQITQRELTRRTRRRVDEVHAFLQGESANPPTPESLCDWVHFCYALELHREAGSLLQYLTAEEVDPAIYRRAKKLAVASRVELGWR